MTQGTQKEGENNKQEKTARDGPTRATRKAKEKGKTEDKRNNQPDKDGPG